MKWLIKESAVFVASIIFAVIAMKLDIWNYMFVYWLIRVYAEMTEGK